MLVLFRKVVPFKLTITNLTGLRISKIWLSILNGLLCLEKRKIKRLKTFFERQFEREFTIKDFPLAYRI